MRNKFSKLTYGVASFGIIAAIYVTLTISLSALSYSWLQIRLSEALTPLPFIMGFSSVVGFQT
jgi:uncharacterized membrane protein